MSKNDRHYATLLKIRKDKVMFFLRSTVEPQTFCVIQICILGVEWTLRWCNRT